MRRRHRSQPLRWPHLVGVDDTHYWWTPRPWCLTTGHQKEGDENESHSVILGAPCSQSRRPRPHSQRIDKKGRSRLHFDYAALLRMLEANQCKETNVTDDPDSRLAVLAMGCGKTEDGATAG